MLADGLEEKDFFEKISKNLLFAYFEPLRKLIPF